MKDLPRPWREGALRLVLAADSVAMARHAVELGIVSADTIAALVEQRDNDPVPPPDRDPSQDALRAEQRNTT